MIWPDVDTEADFKARYGDELGASCWAEFQGKRIDGNQADALNARIATRWDGMRERIAGVLLSSGYLQSVLTAAGADLTPEAIHLSRRFYDQALCRLPRNPQPLHFPRSRRQCRPPGRHGGHDLSKYAQLPSSRAPSHDRTSRTSCSSAPTSGAAIASRRSAIRRCKTPNLDALAPTACCSATISASARPAARRAPAC